jgi:signal transduction histidine kinase
MPVDAPGVDRKPRLAWTVARGVVATVFFVDIVIAALSIWQAGEGVWRTLLAVALMAVVLYIQLVYFSRPGSWLPSPKTYALLGAHAALAYLPILTYGTEWLGLQTFFAGSALLVLPSAAGWTVYALVIGSVDWLQLRSDTSVLDLLYTTLTLGLLSLNVYLLSRLAGLVGELHSARNELAQLAVADERLRFARDLHDLLGLSLSAITLKGELAHRLVHTYPARAKQEVAEILDVARRALTDVRSVAKGYQDLSLEQEAWSAKSVLAASNIDTHLELDYTDLPVPVRTTLGAVLREGVTNVLRHSKAEHCEITVRQATDEVCLDIVNDGVDDDDDTQPDDDGGNGIRNLSVRVAELSGQTTAGLDQDGRFRLHVAIPLATERFEPDDDRGGGASGGGARPAVVVPSEPMSVQERPTLPIHARSTHVLLVVVFTGICLTAVVHLLYMTHDAWKIASSVGYLAALLVLQLAYFSRANTRLRSTQSFALLFVQACLIYLPLFQLGSAWISEPGLLAGSALLVLGPVLGWSVFFAVIGSVIWVHVATTGQPFDIAFNAGATLTTGLIVFGVTALTKLVAELAETRTQLAKMAISEERLRFARDLHDLLGLSLSAMTLKAELTQRLLGIEPTKAADELAEILELARQALADVRSVASSYRELSLDDEYRSAESVLTAADVRVRMDVQYTDLPVLIRTVLAVVLREGVTNVLRHCKAERCDIVIRQTDTEVYLDIVNDGVERADGTATAPVNGSVVAGSGIRNLSYRVAKVGGELHTGLEPDGRFRLRVGVPV